MDDQELSQDVITENSFPSKYRFFWKNKSVFKMNLGSCASAILKNEQNDFSETDISRNIF